MTQCREIPGVTSVKADPVSNTLVVRFDRERTTRERVLAAIAVVVDNVN